MSGQSAEKGPRDGHTFRFRFDIRPSSRVIGDPEYTDAPEFMGPVNEIQVRAWDLRGALLRAAELPFGVLMGNPVSDEAMPDADSCSCGHRWHLHDPEAVPALCLVCGDSERCVIPPGAERDPLECPPDGGCGGCGNWPEHCVCPIPPATTEPGRRCICPAVPAAPGIHFGGIDRDPSCGVHGYLSGSGDTEGAP